MKAKERVKAMERMSKINLNVLTQLCDIFDLSKEGKKARHFSI